MAGIACSIIGNRIDGPFRGEGKVAFCGGVDAQNLLVNGNPSEVKRIVAGLRELFPTGLILSPSHEAVLPDIPPENIMAMFNTINQ